jgi:hypothetical protein
VTEQTEEYEQFARPSARQLRVVAAWLATLRDDLGVTFAEVAEIRRDGSCRFGFDEDEPGSPWLELRPFGSFPSTGYSSAIEWMDVIALRDGRDGDGRPLQVELHSTMLADAGWCWDVSYATADAHLAQRCRDGFGARFSATSEVPAGWRWMLAPQAP